MVLTSGGTIVDVDVTVMVVLAVSNAGASVVVLVFPTKTMASVYIGCTSCVPSRSRVSIATPSTAYVSSLTGDCRRILHALKEQAG